MEQSTTPTPEKPGGSSIRESAPRRPGPLPWLDWRFSLLFPVAVLLLVATALYREATRDEMLVVVVTDQATGQHVAGASVAIGSLVYLSDATGEVRVERPESAVRIEVSATGYQSVAGEFSERNASRQEVVLAPAGQGAGSIASPDPAASNDVALLASSGTASGRVLDGAGNPLHGAIVRSGDRLAVSTGDGTFSLSGVASGATVHIDANGFAGVVLASASMLPDVTLVPEQVKAIYADRDLMMSEGGLDGHIAIANETEINAIVIDIKEFTVLYASQARFFQKAGTVSPVYDATEVLERLEANGIYAIARLVVFQDPLVAEARPDLAVKDSATGGLWRNNLGYAWVSAYEEELWDANIDLATEAIELGFDEVQYDYVRFPSDGDLTTAEFGREHTAETREAAITEFVRRSQEAIHAVGGKLAADLFGYVTLVDDEQYIGQRFRKLEPYLDYVCMMIYPSHFQEGNIASAPGHPNDYPYETIYESLERAASNVPGSEAKFRPWLQDFTYGTMRAYTPEDVRRQIDAAEDFGTSGWMLWGDPFAISVAALEPEG